MRTACRSYFICADERAGEMDNAHPELEFDIVAVSHLF